MNEAKRFSKEEGRAAVSPWGVVAVVVAYGPHVLRLPWWVSVGLAGGLLGGWLTQARHWPPLPRPFRWALSLAAGAAVVASHGRTFALDAGTELLSLAVGLKFLEARSHRDAVLIVLVAYILATTHILFAQHLGMAMVMFASATLTTAALASLETVRPWRENLGLAIRLLLAALPIAAVAFVIIPRLSAGVVGLPLGPRPQAVTGLSDTVAPGSFGPLVQSDATALRAVFDGPLPPRARWYWRAVVLDHVDRDGTWSRRHDAPASSVEGAPRWQGRITLEPHGLPWLVTLDWPTAAPPGARLDQWAGVRRSLPVHERLIYAFRSAETPPPWDGRPHWIALPPGLAPRTRALALTWQPDGPQAVVEQALQLLANGGFRYTLEPRPAGADPVDGLLFETREGFCEHYAAAFAVLLRAAGIPARVVAGYLGGEVNAVAGHITVRQADAHAWVEAVIHPAVGWQRLDPTLVVAPERAVRGIAIGVGAVAPRPTPWGVAWLHTLWDAADHTWSQLVLDFTAQRQRTLWQSLKARLPQIAAMGGLGLVLFAVWRWWRGVPQTSDVAHAAYQDICRWLEAQGVLCQPWEGPRTLRQRLEKEHPNLAVAGELLGQLEVLRYGGDPDAAAAKQLRRTIRQLPRRPS